MNNLRLIVMGAILGGACLVGTVRCEESVFDEDGVAGAVQVPMTVWERIVDLFETGKLVSKVGFDMLSGHLYRLWTNGKNDAGVKPEEAVSALVAVGVSARVAESIIVETVKFMRENPKAVAALIGVGAVAYLPRGETRDIAVSLSVGGLFMIVAAMIAAESAAYQIPN